ncbi:MAG TPA: VOC family protein [Dongiaceae bacterium]|nr:VOC family protein [Dongiaceae bacterium]
MFSHIFIGVNDFDRAYRFYSALTQHMGIELRFCESDNAWAGWHSAGGARPLLVIGKPFNGEPHQAGNGQMVALLASSREQVRELHAIALANGGTCEGAPGLRPHYHPHYYGAYFRDTEGNKLAVACHQPE